MVENNDVKVDLTQQMGLTTVEYFKKGHVAYIALNRPEKLNATTHEVLYDMLACWEDLNADDNAWVAVLSGNGRAFCTGHDFTIKSKRVTEPASLHYGGLDITKPVIAAVHGYALGVGCSMALACDVVICSEDAKFGYPQAKRGLITVGGPIRLPRLIPGAARWYLFSGEDMDAQEAYRLGMVLKVVPREKLMDEATRMALQLCEGSPTSMRYLKQAVERGKLLSLNEALLMSKQLADYAEGHTEDFKEAVAAFKEKRKPVFKNR